MYNEVHVNGLNGLFKIEGNKTFCTPPPSGTRSSVPFGSMGGGIFEMRGDGRFTDSLIYNNDPGCYPNNNWRKMDFPEIMFAVNPNKEYPYYSKTLLSVLHYNFVSWMYHHLVPISNSYKISNEYWIILRMNRIIWFIFYSHYKQCIIIAIKTIKQCKGASGCVVGACVGGWDGSWDGYWDGDWDGVRDSSDVDSGDGFR